MGMASAGGPGSTVSEINVTPLIDVLLVLLILFMVIVPVAPLGLDALVPRPSPRETPSRGDERAVVVQILGASGAPVSFKINDEICARSAVTPRLAQIFSVRQEKVLFIKGGPDVEYGEVASMIDAGHQAGVDQIGILTPKVEAGQ